MPFANKKRPDRPVQGARRPRPTLLQIAQSCDVSIATVSRAINEPHLVKAATRALVLGALKRTRYRLSRLGLTEEGQRPVLGMIASRPADPFFQRTVNILEYAAQQNGYDLHLAFSGLEPRLSGTPFQGTLSHHDLQVEEFFVYKRALGLFPFFQRAGKMDSRNRAAFREQAVPGNDLFRKLVFQHGGVFR